MVCWPTRAKMVPISKVNPKSYFEKLNVKIMNLRHTADCGASVNEGVLPLRDVPECLFPDGRN